MTIIKLVMAINKIAILTIHSSKKIECKKDIMSETM